MTIGAEPIPQEWVKEYAGALRRMADTYSYGTAHAGDADARDALLDRARYLTEMVDAFNGKSGV